MNLTLLVLFFAVAQTPECRTSGGTTACGFSCRAELGEVRCAQTPEGFCTRIDRRLVCWDPPTEVRLHLDSKAPRPTCHAKYRDVACGYACATSPNHVACAQTPYGVCTTRFDEVFCWDPPERALHSIPSSELAGASCVQTNETFACGWSCLKSYQDAQCAQTPRGRCVLHRGQLFCSDPPLPSTDHATK